MPHQRLEPDLPRTDEYHAVNYMLERAKNVADQHGRAPAGYDFGIPAVEREILALGEHSVMWQRDKSHRDAVRDLLIPMLMDAVFLDYNIGHQDVFRALFNVAVEMHSVSYTPMRVMGSTSEAMVKKP